MTKSAAFKARSAWSERQRAEQSSTDRAPPSAFGEEEGADMLLGELLIGR